MGRPAGSTGFCRVVAPAGLLTNPNRSRSRVDPPGRSGFNNYDRTHQACCSAQPGRWLGPVTGLGCWV
jgi:hypothetical protein